jgi:hypothetical protein
MDLKELEQGVDPKTHWYYQSKKLPMLRFIKEVYAKTKKPITLIDLGSGSGFFMYEAYEEIPQLIEKIYLVDIGYSQGEIDATRNQLIEKTLSLPNKIENGLVVMMDVLEHLPDDKAMLQDIKSRSVGVNHFFITVPAFKQLWSGHDVYLGHYRRYTIPMLKKTLKESKINIKRSYYLYGTIFPLVWLVRKVSNKTYKPKSNMKPTAAPVNALLKWWNTVEAKSSRINKLFGVTCVAEGEI